MFGVKKIEKVVSDELYAAQRAALEAAGAEEQAQLALDVARARRAMMDNRVQRLVDRKKIVIVPSGVERLEIKAFNGAGGGSGGMGDFLASAGDGK